MSWFEKIYGITVEQYLSKKLGSNSSSIFFKSARWKLRKEFLIKDNIQHAQKENKRNRQVGIFSVKRAKDYILKLRA